MVTEIEGGWNVSSEIGRIRSIGPVERVIEGGISRVGLREGVLEGRESLREGECLSPGVREYCRK